MGQADKYFQFPISILRDSFESTSDLCQAIIESSVSHLVDHIRPADFDNALPHLAERYADRHELVAYRDYQPDSDHECFLAAAEYLGFEFGSSHIHHVVTRFNRTGEQYPPNGTLCRLRTDIFWDARDHWPINRLRSLIAVYAGIGQNQSQWLAYSRIRALFAGYSGIQHAAQFNNEGLPSVKTVRYWIDDLWQRNLFQMVLANNTKRIYSNKFPDDDALKAYVQKTSRVRKRIQRL